MKYGILPRPDWLDIGDAPDEPTQWVDDLAEANRIVHRKYWGFAEIVYGEPRTD